MLHFIFYGWVRFGNTILPDWFEIWPLIIIWHGFIWIKLPKELKIADAIWISVNPNWHEKSALRLRLCRNGKSQNRSPRLYSGKTRRCAGVSPAYIQFGIARVSWRPFFRWRRKNRLCCNRVFKKGCLALFNFEGTVQPVQWRTTLSYQSLYRNSLGIGRPERKLISFVPILSSSYTPVFLSFK